MRFGPVTVKDRTGRDVILRSAETEDAEALLEYLKVTAGETPFMMCDPEEITMTLEDEKAYIENKTASERELVLVAFADGKHVGNCAFNSIGDFRRYDHRCRIAIAIYKEYWGSGIGRIMLETVLKAAKEAGYEQAELEVVEGNDKARKFYEKLGFVEYGRFPDNMKYKDGSYRDAFWMMKKL